MSSFINHKAESLPGALALLSAPGTVPVGAGGDLLPLIAAGVVQPVAVVDVRAVSELRGIRPEGRALRIGAAMSLADIVGHPDVRDRFPLLAAACEQAITAGAADATLAGNIAQRPCCGYFRRNVACYRNGASACPAFERGDEPLAILEGGPCWSPEPSDVATALVALGATVDVAGPARSRSVAAADFFVLPSVRLDREVALERDEVIVALVLPDDAAGGLQLFTKAALPGATHHAQPSLAAVRRVDGEVRLVLGCVSPRPYRVYSSVEEESVTGQLDEETIEGLAERALLDAEITDVSSPRIEAAASLLRDAIRAISHE